MKRLLLIVLIAYASLASAETTTIYETKDAEGVPNFTNMPETSDKNAKKIIVEDAPQPPADPSAQKPSTLMQQSKAIDQQLQQKEKTEQALKAQLDAAVASQQQAEQNLAEARKAMDDGTYRVGNDQYIDQNYIHHLEELVSFAKQKTATTQSAYNNFTQKNK